MSGNFIKIYSSGAAVDSAFFMNEGTVYFYISNVDKYAVQGKNLVFGSTELIMKHYLQKDTGRIETAVADGKSAIKRMSIDKFLAGMGSFSFSLNVSRVLAQQVLLTNRIIKTNLDSLTGDEKKTQDYSLQYFNIMSRLQREYEKRKIPWIKELVQEFSNTITFKRGEALSRSIEPAKTTATHSLSDKDIEFEKGSVICEEGTSGQEMFILKSGALDVYIKGNRVASIMEPGTIFGEMALLLGEKRSATLRAKNNVIITKISKEDLKDEKVRNSSIVRDIAITLAGRHYYNLIKVGDINRSIIEKSINDEIDGRDKKIHSHHALKELNILKDKVERKVREKGADYMDDMVENF